MSNDTQTTNGSDDDKPTTDTIPSVIVNHDELGRRPTIAAQTEETPDGVELEPSKPTFDERARIGDAYPSQTRKSPVKTALVVLGVIVLAVLLANFWRLIDQLENGQAGLQTNDLATKIEISALKTNVVKNTVGISDLNQKVDPMITAANELAATVKTLNENVQANRVSLTELDQKKADRAKTEQANRAAGKRARDLEKKLDDLIAKDKGATPTPAPVVEKAPVQPKTHNVRVHYYDPKERGSAP